MAYPDAVVDFVLEQLAYEGTYGVSWSRVWEFTSGKFPLDELYKRVAYAWLKDNENLEHLNADGVVIIPAPLTLDEAQLVRLRTEHQWLVLTGAGPKNNSVSGASFQLLCAIAQARSEGIDSMELIAITKQDNRSLTSRIKKIQHLIKKVPIVRNSRQLQLFILLKMYDEESLKGLYMPSKGDDITFNPLDLRARISRALRDARSGLRQVTDLRRELELDKTPKLCVIFRSAMNYLEANGYISKVLVVSPMSPTVKIRALKFVKDYTANDADAEQDDEDDNLEDLIDDQLRDLDEEEGPAALKNMVDLQVVDSASNSAQVPGYNRFYPLQSQIFEIAHKRGISGVAAPELQNILFGKEFSRLFNKFTEYYTSGKFLPHIANSGMIRHYDFKGRSKFYRYMSRPNLLELTSQPQDPSGQSLPPLVVSSRSVDELSKKYFFSLVASPHVRVQDGVKSIKWTGNLEPSATLVHIDGGPQKKRGRPRKGEERVKEVTVKRQRPPKVKPVSPLDDTVRILGTISKKPFVISDIQGHSFKSIERLAAILRVLEDHDGVYENSFVFREEVNVELGFNMDKRTFKNDLQNLVDQGKVYLEDLVLEDDSVLNIVISNNASPEAVEHYKTMKSNTETKAVQARVKLKEEVNADVDFFDMELRETFVKEPKSVHSTVRDRVLPRGSKLQVKKPEKKTIRQKTVKKKITKPLKAISQPLVPAPMVESPEPDFDDLILRKRKRKRVERVGVSQTGRKRRSEQLDSESMMQLFKAVIVCKTLNENQIDWTKISELDSFAGIPPDELRARWPRIRMMMGPNGIQVARRTWKRILLNELRQGNIPTEAVEDLDVETMLPFWNDDVVPLGTLDDSGEKLFVDVEDNYKHYHFVKAERGSSAQYDANSMVQRENHLVGKVFTYSGDELGQEESKQKEGDSKEALIRGIIIAIVVTGEKFELKKLPVLSQFTNEEIDRAFLRMAKKREVVLAADGKVLLGDRLSSVIEDTSFDFSLEKVSHFQRVLKELCAYDKGLVLDPVFDNSCMVPILELIRDNALNLTRVDHYRREVLNGYEARTLERDKLDCDIILSGVDGDANIRDIPKKAIPVPHGKACSRVWINVAGHVNKPIWNKVLRATLITVLANPGITIEGIYEHMSPLLTSTECDLVAGWLIESNSVVKGEMLGHWLVPQWYMVL